MKRRAVTYTLYALAVGLIAVAAAAMPHLRPKSPIVTAPLEPPTPPTVAPTPPPPVEPVVQAPPEPETPEIEVVFALDTTSSMTGLIDGAKRKIWSLVGFISSGQPKPHVKVGLVAYRDVGDAYVTRFYDLSDDIDAVFGHLRALRAEGGGDTPEHVAKALHDAVNRTSWSSGPKVAKMIYLVGDAPPHSDYNDGYDYPALAKRAAAKGIHLNTIRCGDDSETGSVFRQIARLGHGQYATVDGSGGVADTATPFDEKMAMLNKKLIGTAVGYGRSAGTMGHKASSVSMGLGGMGFGVAADRAEYAARKGVALDGEDDLIGRIGTLGKGAGAVNAMPAAALPAPLQAMKPEEREAFVAQKVAERKEVVEEINALAAKRDTYMKAARAKAPRKDGFDDSVRKTIADQASGVTSFH